MFSNSFQSSNYIEIYYFAYKYTKGYKKKVRAHEFDFKKKIIYWAVKTNNKTIINKAFYMLSKKSKEYHKSILLIKSSAKKNKSGRFIVQEEIILERKLN